MLDRIGTSFLALLPLITSTNATPFFQNSGTKDCSKPGPAGCTSIVGALHGWDGFNHEAQGTVTQVTNIAFEGNTSLKMTQTYLTPSYPGRYHSEAWKLNAYTIGDSGFYGFAFRLATDWDTRTASQTYNVAQFIADFGPDEHNSCHEDFLPSTMMWVVGDTLRARRKGGNMCGPWTDGVDYEEYTVGAVRPGTWHRVVIQAGWQSGPTGFFKVWLDGVKKVEAMGKVTTYVDAPRARHFQFSAGLYANSWHDQKKLVGQGTRVLWIDEVGIGSEFKDADPNQWALDGEVEQAVLGGGWAEEL